MNHEGAKNAKEEPPQGGKEEDAVLPSRSTLREPYGERVFAV
jgi:hypothetical protein